MAGLLEGVLPAVYSYGNTMQRKLKGLLADPLGTVGLGVTRAGEDQQQLVNLAKDAGYMPGSRSVLATPEQTALARALLAQKATDMGAGMIGATTAVTDYRGLHRAPMKDSGAPLHDLTGGGKVYPDDVYSPMGRQYYATGDPAIDNEAWNIAMRYKDRPNASVKMYRAVPYEPTAAEQLAKIEKQKADYLAHRIVPPEWGGSRTSIGDEKGFYEWAIKEIDRLKSIPEEVRPKLKINDGDWVTTSRAYAKQHGESALGGNYKILSQTVPARKLFTNGDSWAEFGYDASGRITPEMLGLLAGGTALGLGGYQMAANDGKQSEPTNALVQALRGPR